MKIIEQTETKLVLQRKTEPELETRDTLRLISGIGLSVALGLFIGFHKQHSLRCDRPEPNLVNCEVTHARGFGLFPRQSGTLFNVSEAVIIPTTCRDNDGSYDAHEVNIVASNTTYLFVDCLKSAQEAEAIAANINTNLASQTPSWTITEQDELALFVLAWFFGGMLLLLTLTFRNSSSSLFETHTITLDKASNQLTDELKTPRDQNNHTKHYKLDSMQVKFNEYEDDYKTSYCSLLLTTGWLTQIPIRTEVSGEDIENAQQLYLAICDFLGRSPNS